MTDRLDTDNGMTRDRLIQDHLRQAEGLAHNAWRRNQTADLNDLVGEARLALVRAADRYDPARGKFTTLVHAVVRGALSDFLAASAPVVVPSRERRAHRKSLREGGTGCPLINAATHPRHLDHDDVDDDDDGPARISNAPVDPAAGPEERAIEAQHLAILRRAVMSLPQDERDAVRAYFGMVPTEYTRDMKPARLRGMAKLKEILAD